MVMYAMSGAMVATGDPDRPPLASGPAITQYTAGMHAYIAALMALFRRGRTGRGEHVDLSVQESALENVEIQLTEHLHDGKIARRNGDEHPLVPWRCYPCRDGYAAIIGGPLRHWPAAARMFDEPRLLEPGLLHVGGRIQRRREVEELIKPWLARHDKKDIYRRGQSLGLAFGYLAELPDVLESEQYRARGFFVQTDPHPEVGRLKVCGAPFRLAGAEWRVGRAPLLGEHTEGVLTGLANCSAERLRALSAEGVV
jgi:crotonobetainyl-CoA:carnitine CoA-transferase CaiB-like acyl-CoA transferase